MRFCVRVGAPFAEQKPDDKRNLARRLQVRRSLRGFVWRLDRVGISKIRQPFSFRHPNSRSGQFSPTSD
jgi:hypothetical protein